MLPRPNNASFQMALGAGVGQGQRVRQRCGMGDDGQLDLLLFGQDGLDVNGHRIPYLKPFQRLGQTGEVGGSSTKMP